MGQRSNRLWTDALCEVGTVDRRACSMEPAAASPNPKKTGNPVVSADAQATSFAIF
jgi:hypothetical protein